MTDRPWISIITPSYRCAPYIRHCIQSVLAQHPVAFEHIVLDNCSPDGTVEILKQYPHLRWISEPDRGEADALNKGLGMARGAVIGWLNADDYYLPGIFEALRREFDPSRGRHIIYGRHRFVDEDGRLLEVAELPGEITLEHLVRFWRVRLRQPSLFYSREAVADIGRFRTDLHFSIDYEYWLRLVRRYRFHYVDHFFSHARIRGNSKSFAPARLQHESHERISAAYLPLLSPRQRIAYARDFLLDYRTRLAILSALGRIEGLDPFLRILARLHLKRDLSGFQVWRRSASVPKSRAVL